jgi:hypothetical protein
MRTCSYLVSLPIALITFAACGGADSPGPGDQTYMPPAGGSGSADPSDATSVTCHGLDDCDYWFCQCADGAVVNSSLCQNGFCMGAKSACPDACHYFNHGDWTGQAGGGPDQGHGSGSGQSCGTLGSSNATCNSCVHDSCCNADAACSASGACVDYWNCAITCNGDASCLDVCDQNYPAGRSNYEQLESCINNSCGGACAL